MKTLQKIVSIILVFLIIFTLSYSVLADNTISNNTVINEINTSANETNTVRELTLEEQKKEVEQKLKEANLKLEYVESELSSKTLYIAKIEDKMMQYQQEAEEANSKYQQILSLVDTAEKELEEGKSQFEKERFLFGQRLAEMYKHGSTSYIDVLLDSKDVIDLISNYIIVETMIEYDNKKIQSLNNKRILLERKAKELQQQKANLKLIKIDAEKKTVLLTNTKIVLENEKVSLDEKEKTIISEIDNYRKQQIEIENLIQTSIFNSTYQLKYSGGVMIWPTLQNNYITSPYGSRLHPIQGVVKKHDGIDIGGNYGDPVYAAYDGIIIYYTSMGGYGNAVMVDHGTKEDGTKIVTLYGHGNEYIEGLSVGSQVKQGQEIMKMGSTGNSTGPHVHFEVRENGVPVDPKKYLSNNE